MATSSFTNGMFLKNKEEVKRFCEILSSKPKNGSRLEKVDYEVISGRELLNLLKNLTIYNRVVDRHLLINFEI